MAEGDITFDMVLDGTQSKRAMEQMTRDWANIGSTIRREVIGPLEQMARLQNKAANLPPGLKRIASDLDRGLNVNPERYAKIREHAMTSQQAEAERLAAFLKKTYGTSLREAKKFNDDLARQREKLTGASDRFSSANQNVLGRIDNKGGAEFLSIQAKIIRNFVLLGAAAQGLRMGVRFIIDLDKAFRQLQAITQTTDFEMQKLEKSLIAVSEKTKFTALEVAEAATTLGQAGFSTAEIEASIESITLLATATGSTLAESVDVATSVMGIFNLQASEMSNVTNTMTAAINNSKLTMNKLALGLQYSGNIAKQSGVSFSELTTVLGALANAGIRSGSTLGTGLRQLMIDLQAPTAKLEKRLTSLGLTFADIDIRSKGVLGVMRTLTSAGFTSADAMQTLEVRSAAAFSAISDNLDFADDFRTAITGTQAAVTANATQMEAFANQLARLGSVAGTIISNFAEPFLRVMTNIIETLADTLPLLNSMTGVFQALTTAAAAFVAIRMGKFLAGLIPSLIKMNREMTQTRNRTVMLQNAMMGLGSSVGTTRNSLGQFTSSVSTSSSRLKMMMSSVVGLSGSLIATAGLSIAMGIVIQGFYELSQMVETSAEKTDRLKGELNEAKDSFDGIEKSIDSVYSAIDELDQKADELENNPILRGQVMREVAEQFKEFGLAVDGSKGEVVDLRNELLLLSDQLRLEAVNKARESLVAAGKVQEDALAAVKEEPSKREFIDSLKPLGFSTSGFASRQTRVGVKLLPEILQSSFGDAAGGSEVKALAKSLFRDRSSVSSYDIEKVVTKLLRVQVDSDQKNSDKLTKLITFFRDQQTIIKAADAAKGEVRKSEQTVIETRAMESPYFTEAMAIVSGVTNLANDLRRKGLEKEGLLGREASFRDGVETIDQKAVSALEGIKMLARAMEDRNGEDGPAMRKAFESFGFQDKIKMAQGVVGSEHEKVLPDFVRSQQERLNIYKAEQRAIVAGEKTAARTLRSKEEINAALERSLAANNAMAEAQIEQFELEAEKGKDTKFHIDEERKKLATRNRQLTTEFGVFLTDLDETFEKESIDVLQSRKKLLEQGLSDAVKAAKNGKGNRGEFDRDLSKYAEVVRQLNIAEQSRIEQPSVRSDQKQLDAADLAEDVRRYQDSFTSGGKSYIRGVASRNRSYSRDDARRYAEQMKFGMRRLDEALQQEAEGPIISMIEESFEEYARATVAAVKQDPNFQDGTLSSDQRAQRLTDVEQQLEFERRDLANELDDARNDNRDRRVAPLRKNAKRSIRQNQLLISNLIASKTSVLTKEAYEASIIELERLQAEVARDKQTALGYEKGIGPEDLLIARQELDVEIGSTIDRQLERLEEARQTILDGKETERQRDLARQKRQSAIQSRRANREASYKQSEISDVLTLPDDKITEAMIGNIRAAGLARATAAEEAFRARPEFLDEGSDRQQIEFEVEELLKGIRNDTRNAVQTAQTKILDAQKKNLRGMKRFADRDLSSTQEEIDLLLKDIDEGTVNIVPGIQKYRELIRTLKEQTAKSFNLDPNNNFLAGDDLMFAQEDLADQQTNISANADQVIRKKRRQAEEKRLRISKRLADKEVGAIEHEIEELERRIDDGEIGLEAGIEEYRTLLESLTTKMVEAFKADPSNNFLNEEEQTRVDEALVSMKTAIIDDAVRTTQEILKKAGHSGQGVTPDTVRPGGTTPTGQGVQDAMSDYIKGTGRAKTPYEITEEAIGKLESGFKSLFQTMIDGSASAGDAFKAFGRGILEAMTEIAVSEAAKGFMRLILGSLGGDAPTGGGGGGKGLLGTLGSFVGSLFGGGAAPVNAASGTILPAKGATRGRDSIPHSLMPGEAVLRAKAVRSLGPDTVARMNSMGRDSLALESLPASMRGTQQKDGIEEVNVWIVSPEQKPSLGPKDVLAVISDDIVRNGSTARLIKTVSSGVKG